MRSNFQVLFSWSSAVKIGAHFQFDFQCSFNTWTFVSRDESAPKATLNFALSVLSLGTKLSNDERFPDSSSNASLESAMAGSFFVLEQASSTRSEGIKIDSHVCVVLTVHS